MRGMVTILHYYPRISHALITLVVSSQSRSVTGSTAQLPKTQMLAMPGLSTARNFGLLNVIYSAKFQTFRAYAS